MKKLSNTKVVAYLDAKRKALRDMIDETINGDADYILVGDDDPYGITNSICYEESKIDNVVIDGLDDRLIDICEGQLQ